VHFVSYNLTLVTSSNKPQIGDDDNDDDGIIIIRRGKNHHICTSLPTPCRTITLGKTVSSEGSKKITVQ
jgi:hypothetical protein